MQEKRDIRAPSHTSPCRTTCRIMILNVSIGIGIGIGIGAGIILVRITSGSNTGWSNHKISRSEKILAPRVIGSGYLVVEQSRIIVLLNLEMI